MCKLSPHGELGELKAGAPLVFCGIEVQLIQDRHITLYQDEFYRKIPEFHQFVRDDKMLLSERIIQMRLKCYAGCCLWLLNTRFDLVFSVAQLACILLDSLSNLATLKLFISLSRKLLDRIQDRAPLSFFPF